MATRFAEAGVQQPAAQFPQIFPEGPAARYPDKRVAGFADAGKQAEKPEKYYRVAVADNGTGFENEFAESAFELTRRLHGP